MSESGPIPPKEPGSHGGQDAVPAHQECDSHEVDFPQGDIGQSDIGQSDIRQGEGEKTTISKRPPVSLSPSLSPYPDDVARQLTGQRLGHFDLREAVGGGGMGVVFRAYDTLLDRDVALKVLARDLSADTDVVRRFKNEAQSAARLDHENIARVYLVGEDSGWHYIVFEYVEGVNLRDLVEQRGPLPLPEALGLVIQVAQALSHASRRDVIHRDIKPSNVLIAADGKVKLVDMGLARLHQVEHPDNDLTASGVTLGTFDYISPEQARDPRGADVRSDLYSLGCTFYFVLTGRPPFPMGTMLQKLLQHQGDSPPDPRELRKDLPDAIVPILSKLLAKSPEKRYQTPDILIRELLHFAEEAGIVLENIVGPVWHSEDEMDHRWWYAHIPWVVPLALLIIIVAVLDFYWSPTYAYRNPQNPRSLSTGATPLRERVPATSPDTSLENQLKESPRLDTTQSSNTLDLTHANALPAETGSLDQTEKGETAEQNDEQIAPHQDAIPATGSNPSIAVDGQKPLHDSSQGDKSPLANELEKTLVVKDLGSDGLQRAIGNSTARDVIELRYTGTQQSIPIRVSNQHVEIRGTRGFMPTIRFDPIADTDPIQSDTFDLYNADVTLENVHLELRVPSLPQFGSHRWSMFRLRGQSSIQLMNCTITIRNPNRQSGSAQDRVDCFRIEAVSDKYFPLREVIDAELPVIDIELNDCLVRGEATFLHARDNQPISLVWNNGLLATDRKFLLLEGSEYPPRYQDRVRVNLRRIIANVDSGFAELKNSTAAPHQLPAEIMATLSVFRTDNNAPLAKIVGVDVNSDPREFFNWIGDRNYFDGFTTFWQAEHVTKAYPPLQLNFSEWRQFFNSKRERVIQPEFWVRLPSKTSFPHEQSADDYELQTDTTITSEMTGTVELFQPGFSRDKLPYWAQVDN